MNQNKNKEEVREDDLWNNPMVRAAKAAMSPKEIEEYARIGHAMYGHLNFEDPRVTLDPQAKMSAALTCLEGQVRSGLHPSDMDTNEKAILEDAYGKEWYLKWGFVKEDLDDVVTLGGGQVVIK